MKNNEVITTTGTEIESKALAPELVERREEHIHKYEVACRNIEGSAWNLARTVYSAIHDSNFDEMFGSIEAYAKEVGTSRTNVSKLEKVYARKLEIGQADDSGFSTSQLMEFGRIDVEETNEAIKKESISPDDTCKAIRKKVKHYLNGASTSESESEEEENQTETEEDEVVGDVVIVEINGERTQILNPEIIEKIKALLEE